MAEPPEDYKKFLFEKFSAPVAEMLLKGYGKQKVLDEGNPDCEHGKILYANNAFDGQAWWCDNCSRHEMMGYSPGLIIKFPPHALIRTPNPQFGGEGVYSHRANANGIVEGMLPNEERVITEDAQIKLEKFLEKHR